MKNSWLNYVIIAVAISLCFCSCNASSNNDSQQTTIIEKTYAKDVLDDDAFVALHPEVPYYYKSIRTSVDIADNNPEKQYKSGNYMVSDFNDGICIHEYLGKSSFIDIPEKINGKSVIRLGVITDSDKSVAYSISIPKTVKYIERFDVYIDNIAEVTVAEDNPYYSSKDGVLYNKDKTVLICAPYSYKEKVFDVPKSVKCVYEIVFDPVRDIKVQLHKNVDKIYYSDIYYEVDEDNENYSSVDGVLFNGNTTEMLYFPERCVVVDNVDDILYDDDYDYPDYYPTGSYYQVNYEQDYIVPDSVEIINDELNLKKCVQKLTFGKNIKKIGLKLDDIPEDVDMIYSLRTIKGYKGTVAETFAKENYLEFVPLD